MSTLATLTTAGLSGLAKALKDRPLHMAWGTGDPAWDTDPSTKPGLADATALTAEVGRRLLRAARFAVPDPAGDITAPSGLNPDGTLLYTRYRVSDEPAPWLYVQAGFEHDEASDVTIREVALFMDTVTKPGLPPGQRYFTPGEVTDPGLMMVAQILDAPIIRSAAQQQNIEFIFSV